MAVPAQEYHALVGLGGVGQDEVQRLLRALAELDAVSVAGAWPLVTAAGDTAYVVHLVHASPGADAAQVRGALRIAGAATGVTPDIVRDVTGFAIDVGR
jgi:hypothetical protein